MLGLNFSKMPGFSPVSYFTIVQYAGVLEILPQLHIRRGLLKLGLDSYFIEVSSVAYF